MPVFIAAIGGMLINLVGTLVGRVMIALGISVITYTGMSTSLEWLKTNALQAVSGLPSQVIQILGILRVGQCISIVFSAILARMIIQGLQGDTIKKWVTK